MQRAFRSHRQAVSARTMQRAFRSHRRRVHVYTIQPAFRSHRHNVHVYTIQRAFRTHRRRVHVKTIQRAFRSHRQNFYVNARNEMTTSVVLPTVACSADAPTSAAPPAPRHLMHVEAEITAELEAKVPHLSPTLSVALSTSYRMTIASEAANAAKTEAEVAGQITEHMSYLMETMGAHAVKAARVKEAALLDLQESEARAKVEIDAVKAKVDGMVATIRAEVDAAAAWEEKVRATRARMIDDVVKVTISSEAANAEKTEAEVAGQIAEHVSHLMETSGADSVKAAKAKEAALLDLQEAKARAKAEMDAVKAKVDGMVTKVRAEVDAAAAREEKVMAARARLEQLRAQAADEAACANETFEATTKAKDAVQAFVQAREEMMVHLSDAQAAERRLQLAATIAKEAQAQAKEMRSKGGISVLPAARAAPVLSRAPAVPAHQHKAAATAHQPPATATHHPTAHQLSLTSSLRSWREPPLRAVPRAAPPSKTSPYEQPWRKLVQGQPSWRKPPPRLRPSAPRSAPPSSRRQVTVASPAARHRQLSTSRGAPVPKSLLPDASSESSALALGSIPPSHAGAEAEQGQAPAPVEVEGGRHARFESGLTAPAHSENDIAFAHQPLQPPWVTAQAHRLQPSNLVHVGAHRTAPLTPGPGPMGMMAHIDPPSAQFESVAHCAAVWRKPRVPRAPGRRRLPRILHWRQSPSLTLEEAAAQLLDCSDGAPGLLKLLRSACEASEPPITASDDANLCRRAAAAACEQLELGTRAGDVQDSTARAIAAAVGALCGRVADLDVREPCMQRISELWQTRPVEQEAR